MLLYTQTFAEKNTSFESYYFYVILSVDFCKAVVSVLHSSQLLSLRPKNQTTP